MKTASTILLVFLVGSLIALAACGQQPSPKERATIEALKGELDNVRTEIQQADTKNRLLQGGLVKALVEARIEILKTTEALIQQRIHAMESGARITVEVVGSSPDPEQAARLEDEIRKQRDEIQKAQEDADQYSGGLVHAMKLASVATHEQTLAMLTQRYLAAKYGLAYSLASVVEEAETSTIDALPERASEDESSDQILTVKLLRKQFREQDYQEYIFFDVEYIASGLDKPARAIKGTLNLQDLFGEVKMRLGWTIDKPTEPGETATEKGTGFEYNQFRDEHQWVRTTSVENMTVSFTVTSILYQDGSRRDF